MSDQQSVPSIISPTPRMPAEAPTPSPAAVGATGRSEAVERGPDALAKDPMQVLLDRMERAVPLIRQLDPALGRAIERLVQQGSDPESRGQQGFRHEVAYRLQDLEKTPIGRIEITPGLRTEMTQLVGSAPGLENPRMLALLGSTGALQDRVLIKEIRAAGGEIGREADQGNPERISRIENLENRVRLSQRPAETLENTSAKSEQGPPSVEHQPPQATTTAQARPADGGSANGQTQQAAGQPQQVLAAQTPLDTIFSRMRHGGSKEEGAPWDPAPTPMKDRLSAFETVMQSGKDMRLIESAEKTGRAALEALRGFSTGEGAEVMGRIQQAAKADPGGMAAVMSEMREGGRYADLRGQFNNALLDERGMSKAYDSAASSLAQYAKDRPGIEQAIARRPDAANIAAKFESLDAAIGEAAGATPSRKDGRSMVDDLAKTAAELVQRAVEAVKSVFRKGPSEDASARPSSPSPG
jgi:hypothetical protein